MSGLVDEKPEPTDEPSLVRPYTLTAGRTDPGFELPCSRLRSSTHHRSEGATLARTMCSATDPTSCVHSRSVASQRSPAQVCLAARCDTVPGRRPGDTGLCAGAFHTRRLMAIDDRRELMDRTVPLSSPSGALRRGPPPLHHHVPCALSSDLAMQQAFSCVLQLTRLGRIVVCVTTTASSRWPRPGRLTQRRLS